MHHLLFTTVEDILCELKNVIEVNEIEWTKFNSTCTDGAFYLTGSIKGFVTLLENYLEKKKLSITVLSIKKLFLPRA